MTDTPIERLKGLLAATPDYEGDDPRARFYRGQREALKAGIHALATIEPIPSAGEGERAYWPTSDRHILDCDPTSVAGLSIMSACDGAPYAGVDQAEGEKPKRADVAFWDRVSKEAGRIASWAVQGLAISGRALATLPSEPLRDD